VVFLLWTWKSGIELSCPKPAQPDCLLWPCSKTS
jgi:hypothetical protein